MNQPFSAGDNPEPQPEYPAPGYPNYAAAPPQPGYGYPEGWNGQGFPPPGAPATYAQAAPVGQGVTSIAGAPPSNVGWAVASLLFWPLAFLAFSRAFEVLPLWLEGRQEEAHNASKLVKTLGIIALVVGVVLLLAVVVIAFVAGSIAATV